MTSDGTQILVQERRDREILVPMRAEAIGREIDGVGRWEDAAWVGHGRKRNEMKGRGGFVLWVFVSG